MHNTGEINISLSLAYANHKWEQCTENRGGCEKKHLVGSQCWMRVSSIDDTLSNADSSAHTLARMHMNRDCGSSPAEEECTSGFCSVSPLMEIVRWPQLASVTPDGKFSKFRMCVCVCVCLYGVVARTGNWQATNISSLLSANRRMPHTDGRCACIWVMRFATTTLTNCHWHCARVCVRHNGRTSMNVQLEPNTDNNNLSDKHSAVHAANENELSLSE